MKTCASASRIGAALPLLLPSARNSSSLRACRSYYSPNLSLSLAPPLRLGLLGRGQSCGGAVMGQPRRGLSSRHNEVFDKELLLRRRGASAVLSASGGAYDYLRRECAERIVDRLDDISRPFPDAVDLGCDTGHVFTALTARNGPSGETQTGGVQTLLQCDTSCLLPPPRRRPDGEAWTEGGISTRFLAIDDENLELAPGSCDLILSSLHLHWVNHLPSLLGRVKKALRPDGAFIGCMLGGSTLRELRHCFFLAEQERRGGVSPHCSPFARPSDVSALMQGAGFALPTIDVDTITVGSNGDV